MTNGETKLLIPGLSGFYAAMTPVAEALLRVVVGAMFLMHVSAKFHAGAAATAANIFAKNGIEPALLIAEGIMALELVGGACLLVGLFTRFFAAAFAIEMLVAVILVNLPKGYAANAGGYEYVLMIGAVCFLLAIRGGGAWSIDRFLGKEL